MTWEEFKEAVEAAGVEDGTKIGHIHWHDDESIKVTPYAGGAGVRRKVSPDAIEQDVRPSFSRSTHRGHICRHHQGRQEYLNPKKDRR
jgi:hypothetical protein